ncbi:MAG: RsmD family RNA methyltransferase, partial [Proteobacteria bacterium]|nr:RsmD family RNA methyltransferase [Pseudomonadota bacterium]
MRARPKRTSTAARSSHERGAQARRLRIIAGRWRGRRWQFPHGEIRPTGDRVRETLFNWLQGKVAGRRCLDLYAGSGALGLEALSRGAAHCVFVDQDAQVIAGLGDVLREWGAGSEQAELV